MTDFLARPRRSRCSPQSVINRQSDEDEPLYPWADVRKLRAEQWKVAAG
jgi:hypothetical protein